jgi:hypothetical protein
MIKDKDNYEAIELLTANKGLQFELNTKCQTLLHQACLYKNQQIMIFLMKQDYSEALMKAGDIN